MNRYEELRELMKFHAQSSQRMNVAFARKNYDEAVDAVYDRLESEVRMKEIREKLIKSVL